MPKKTKKLHGMGLLWKVSKDMHKRQEEAMQSANILQKVTTLAMSVECSVEKTTGNQKTSRTVEKGFANSSDISAPVMNIKNKLLLKKKRTKQLVINVKKSKTSNNSNGDIMEVDELTFSQAIMPPPPCLATEVAVIEKNKTVQEQYFDEVDDVLFDNIQMATADNVPACLRIPENVTCITSPYLLEQYFEVFCKDNFVESYLDPTSYLDVNSLFGYLMYVAYVGYDKIKSLIVNIAYTIGIYNQVNISPRQGAWGDPDNYEVLFVPIFFREHFALVIHEKGGQTLFYDPQPNVNRLHLHPLYLPAIKNAILEYV